MRSSHLLASVYSGCAREICESHTAFWSGICGCESGSDSKWYEGMVCEEVWEREGREKVEDGTGGVVRWKESLERLFMLGRW